MMDQELDELSGLLGRVLCEHSLTLATAESCTGGWVAQVVTHTAGSSGWFERGFVTYTDEAKIDMLGVRSKTLIQQGAVSQDVAAEMAEGAIENSNALISLSITGIAGPGGGSPGKPVGTVCFGWCRRGQRADTDRQQFSGDRFSVRRQSVLYALKGLMSRAKTVP